MPPAIEPRSRAARVDRRRRAQMLAEIQQNVDESVPYLARRGEGACVVPITPNGAAALPSAIERTGGATVQRIQASAKSVAGISFNDEMDVIGLDGEMHDTEGVAAAQSQCPSQWHESSF